MRITRTTAKGATYASSFKEAPTPETLEALDGIADAALAENQAEQEARAYALSTDPGEHIRPRDLQAVTKGAISFNAACRVLEDLEKDGELVRTTNALHAGMLVWMRAQPPGKPPAGYALPLSSREHGALLRGLDKLLSPLESYQGTDLQEDIRLLRAIRARMKRPA